MNAKKSLRSAVGTVIVTLAIATSAWAGSLTGTVTYDGKVPKLKPMNMTADPNCVEKHGESVPNPMLALGENNAMANIFVQVVKGVPDKKYPAPSEPATVDQVGCMFEPHVVGIQVGQPFRILNSDGILHNVHSFSKKNRSFNLAMPADMKQMEKSFRKEEFMFKIKCDVHPWMLAYIAVMEHPFYDVTGTDGKFSIEGLDAGTYTLEIWHEKLGSQQAEVTLGADETKTLDFSMSPPKRR